MSKSPGKVYTSLGFLSYGSGNRKATESNGIGVVRNVDAKLNPLIDA